MSSRTDYRNGYADAKALISDLDGDIAMASHAEPPAMSEDYRDGFAQACKDAKQRLRPNRNHILSIMRDNDMYDPWGAAMAWAFACAENLAMFGQAVPNELGYRMSIAGPCVESYEDFQVAEYLGAEVDIENETVEFDLTNDSTEFEARIAEVQFAGRCLARYIDWCKAAGKDY